MPDPHRGQMAVVPIMSSVADTFCPQVQWNLNVMGGWD